ncbi:MAG: SpoIIIAH-like family protein [Christensenellaceae bacterium]|jgi:stage III sporulation protein AH|nr:SpoIIIAH-like family protein [Christensenellaceae bacterium]
MFFKKYGVIIVAALLLAGAVYLNVRMEDAQTAGIKDGGEDAAPGPAEQAAQTEPGTGYFEYFRNERDAVRGTEIGYLDEVIAASASDAETLAEAQAQKLALVDNMEKEFTIESLIKAKGFVDAAVTFHKGSVNVIVDCEELNDEKVAQILDIVQRETGENADHIKIMPGG